jgi:hypothetical protein
VVGLILRNAVLGLEMLSIVHFVVLPVLGCGLCPQAVTVKGILSRQVPLPHLFGPTAVLDRQ